jgi:hypothetical protein
LQWYFDRKWHYDNNRRNPPTCCKSMTNCYHIMLHRLYMTWAGFELTTLVVVGIDCIVCHISNYHVRSRPRRSLFEQTNCSDWIYCLVIYCIALSGTAVTGYLLSCGNIIVNPVHFLLTEKYQKGQSRDNHIILLFNSKYKP